MQTKIAPVTFAALAALATLVACGGHGDDVGAYPYPSLLDPASDAEWPRLAAPIVVESPCHIEIATPPLLKKLHIPPSTALVYDSVPASSGPHYPYASFWGVHDIPVDPRLYVHNLEHGGVALFFRCAAGTDCSADQARAGMISLAQSLPDDPLCDPSARYETEGVRVLVAPEPELDVPVAAAAWGWTYRADCYDPESLGRFVSEHYGHGPEATCE